MQVYSAVAKLAGANKPYRDLTDHQTVTRVLNGTMAHTSLSSQLPYGGPYHCWRYSAGTKQWEESTCYVDYTGKIDHHDQVGGYQIGPAPGQPDPPATFIDVDNDGVDDAWEKARGLDFNNPAHLFEGKDRNGYSELEDYLNFRAGE
jgi:hypothetical protein